MVLWLILTAFFFCYQWDKTPDNKHEEFKSWKKNPLFAFVAKMKLTGRSKLLKKLESPFIRCACAWLMDCSALLSQRLCRRFKTLSTPLNVVFCNFSFKQTSLYLTAVKQRKQKNVSAFRQAHPPGILSLVQVVLAKPLAISTSTRYWATLCDAFLVPR